MANTSYQNKKEVSRGEEESIGKTNSEGIKEEKKKEINLDKIQEEKEYWMNYAKYYKYIENSGPYREIGEKIQKLLEEKEGNIVLDAGCGIGSIFQQILKKTKCSKLIAVDFNLNALKQAEERKNLFPNEDRNKIEIKKMDLSRKTPFDDNAFDAVIANASICYISKFESQTGQEALKGLLKEMKRIMKPEGYICWSTFIKDIDFKKVYLRYIHEVFKQSPQALIAGIKLKKITDHFHSKHCQGLYHFLLPSEIEKIHSEVGLTVVQTEYAMAGQCIIIKAKKQ